MHVLSDQTNTLSFRSPGWKLNQGSIGEEAYIEINWFNFLYLIFTTKLFDLAAEALWNLQAKNIASRIPYEHFIEGT